MADRKKVIKAVECRKNAHKRCGNPCERTGGCKYAAWVRDPDGEPYYPCYCDTEKLCTDILFLLREQEAVEPTRKVNENGQILSCGNCGAWFIVQKQKYCHECGRKLKWE